VQTALNVSLGNEPCSPANNRAKIDASREYSGWWAGFALSHGAAITLGAYSPPPCSQNWQPNTAKWRNNASFWLPLLGTSKPKRRGSILRRSGCNLPNWRTRGRTVGAQERAKHPQCAAELAVSVGLFRRTVTSLKKPVVRVAVSRTKFQQISQPQGIAVTCTGSLLGALTAHLSNAPPLNCIGMRGGREPSPFCSTNRSQCSFLKDTLSLTRYTSNFPSLI
jgi:hypothetical protein